MDSLQSLLIVEEIGPPDYVYFLIQVSILAEIGDVNALSQAIEIAKQKGAENNEILRAMFRSDGAFVAGVEGTEFSRIAQSLQAGRVPLVALG